MAASQNNFFLENEIKTINPLQLTAEHRRILRAFLKPNLKEKVKKNDIYDVTIGGEKISFSLTHDLLKSDENEYEVLRKVDDIIFLDENDPLPSDPVANTYVLRKEIISGKKIWVIHYYDEEKKERMLKKGFPSNLTENQMLDIMDYMPYSAIPIFQTNNDIILSAGHILLVDSDVKFIAEPRIIKKINPKYEAYLAIQDVLNEFKISAKIRHLHIKPPVIVNKNEIYLILKNIKGITVAKKIKEPQLSLDEKIELALEFLYDLYARTHLESVVHVDLKPANAIVKPNGKVKIIDYGYATEIQMEMIKHWLALIFYDTWH